MTTPKPAPTAPTEQDRETAREIINRWKINREWQGVAMSDAENLTAEFAAALQAERERTRAEEREACADLVERIQVRVPSKVVGDVINDLCDKIAAAIRARAL